MLGCAVPVTPAPEPAAPKPRVSSGLEAGARSIEIRAQQLELLLPDADGWRHDRRDTRSWVAHHAATHSRLIARAWRADAIVRASDCERQMHLWRPDLEALAPDERIETRAARVAGDYAGEIWSGVTRPAGARAELKGYAQLFASDGRQCLCLAYTTSAEGADVERVVGERLGVITRLVFERVRRLEMGERVVVPRQ